MFVQNRTEKVSYKFSNEGSVALQANLYCGKALSFAGISKNKSHNHETL